MSAGESNESSETPVAMLSVFWAMWVREQRFLRGHAHQLACRGGANADDLTDEALDRAIAATLRGAGPRTGSRSWLRLLLDRTSVDEHRRRQRFDDPEETGVFEMLSDSWATPELALMQRQERQRLQRALKALPKDWRKPLVLREIEGYEYGEIARRLKITPANARKRVQLARALLREAGSPARVSSRRE